MTTSDTSKHPYISDHEDNRNGSPPAPQAADVQQAAQSPQAADPKAYEETRLRMVEGEIHRQIQTIEKAADEKRRGVVEMRRQVQEDLSSDFSDVEPALEMVHHSMEMALKEMDYLSSMDRLKVLDRMRHSPYFGRVDFLYEGEDEPENIYIGISSLKTLKSGDYLVYDWRAPISSLFYDYQTGPAQFVTEAGVVSGDVLLKRQFKIAKGQLEFMFDTGMNIGDEVLQEMMGKHADERMKSIVATIQQEQNAVIRNDETKVLVVQGAAGSGKTSIALQRIAYLLYKYRKTLSADDILMFTPNPLFASYIRDVLPELGEENVPQTTFYEFAQKRLGTWVELEDMATQIEEVLTAPNTQTAVSMNAGPATTAGDATKVGPATKAGDATKVGSAIKAGIARKAGIAWKASPSFLKLLTLYMNHIERGNIEFRDIVQSGNVLISKAEIAEVNQSYRYLPISKRFQPIVSWLKRRVSELREERLEERIDQLKRVTTYVGTDAEIEQIAKSEVKKEFVPVVRQVKRYALVTAYRHYARLFADGELLRALSKEGNVEIPNGIDQICAFTRKSLANRRIPYEDIAPLVYVVQVMNREESLQVVKHVVVDEAQDLSPVHYQVLQMTFPNSRFTILGDINQSIHPQMNIGAYENLIDVFGQEATSILTLGRSYRSTKEIVAFASAILGDPNAIESVNRHGTLPLVVRYAKGEETQSINAVVTDVQARLDEGRASVAIVCKTAAESDKMYSKLRDKLDVQLVTKEDADFKSRVCVIPAYLAKGLEFDAVIVWNADREHYGEESDRKMLYTVCSRALHELHVYYEREPSPFMPTEDESLCNHIQLS